MQMEGEVQIVLCQLSFQPLAVEDLEKKHSPRIHKLIFILLQVQNSNQSGTITWEAVASFPKHCPTPQVTTLAMHAPIARTSQIFTHSPDINL